MRHQSKISWFALLTGRVSLCWSHAQHAHQARMHIDRPTLRWTSAMLQQLFLIAWDMWQDRNNIKQNSITAAKQREIDRLDAEIDKL